VDVHDKLDELIGLVEGARGMPLSTSCWVDRPEVLDLLDQIRELLPRDLSQADRVLSERDLIIDEGRRTAEHLVEEARVEQARLVSEHEVYQAALAEGDAVRGEASDEASRMRREVDDYVDAKLANFEYALDKTIRAVQNGRDKIRGRAEYDSLADAPDLRGDQDLRDAPDSRDDRETHPA
jgi:vacuolar-type H+-ATPase subunit H